MRRFGITVTIMALAILVGSASAKVFEFRTTDEFPVDAGFRLSVENTSGDVKIVQQPGTKLTVEAIKEVDASSREDAEKLEELLEVKIDANNSRVKIETRYPKGFSGGDFFERLFGVGKDNFNASVRYVISVPVTVSVDVATVSGDVTLAGLTGDFAVATTSGDIDLKELSGNAEISSTSGDIRFKDIKGDVDISGTSSDVLLDNIAGDVVLKSTSGNTEAYYISGSTRITNTSGDIRMENTSGDVDISTTSGNIGINQSRGAVFVHTISGDVRVRTEMQGQSYQVETISGNVELEVPSEAKGRVKLQTASGTINTELPLEVRSFSKNRIEGTIRGDGPEIMLKSMSGDITLAEY